MTGINTYLTFNGNCKEAMTFYRQCLGGELTFQKIGDSPLTEKMPARMKECILHATLMHEQITLMATDLVGEQGLQQGNAMSLMLHCSSETEIKKLYTLLSEGGAPTHPLRVTIGNDLLGNLTDRFGIHWLLHFRKTNHP